MRRPSDRRGVPRTGALVLLALLGGLGALAPRRAQAHLPPPAYLLVDVGEESVRVKLAANVALFEDWFGVERAAVPDAADGPIADAVRERVRGVLEGFLTVTIDRVVVEGTLASVVHETFVDHEFEWHYVNTAMVYPTKGMPREVSLVWTRYGGPFGFVVDALQCEITGGGGKTVYATFREEEPGFTWHRPLAPPPPPAATLPPPAPRPRLPIPLLSVGLVLVTALGLLATRRRRVNPALRSVGAVAGLALAVLLSGVARTEVSLPDRGGFERPSDEQTLYLFESLLRNVYRAFDYDSESQIYDTLARSVTGSLLQSVYFEVHTSLVLQDQGGAVCKVESVDVLSKEVLPPPTADTPVLRVRARWTVHGKVGHWGHTHQRVNEYQADFTIVQDEGAWKISALDVASQVRVDDGGSPR